MIKRILHIVGTRPQYIKLFPLWNEIKKESGVEQYIYDTGQHYDEEMSRKVIEEFGFQNIAFGNIAGMGPERQIPLMITNIWNEILSYKPDYVFLYGDTNSTMAGAIACAKNSIPYGHLEAGVRTEAHIGIQEGVNRKVADHLATHHFCVNSIDYKNLNNEGVDRNKNFLVGDLMYDAFSLIKAKFSIEESKRQEKFLVTIHRAENVDNELRRKKLINFLIELSEDVDVVLPLHPRLKLKATEKELVDLEKSNVTVVSPLTYSNVIKELINCNGVITDSGGLPKDAAYAGVKSVVLRDDPIWEELHKLDYISTVNDIDSITENELKKYCLNKLGDIMPIYECDIASAKIISIVKKYLNT
ncbi:UDP-N-acetylglucosamine 2-epimerase [Marinomonas sp. MED121]|uniref:UDP-N-acetyl glucosamine 2-epimerase n=1 Tax=Marinomonas sp. MED121 TaxID=314277 RepID=UPI0000690051|nr:UDP-N-acetylglucosamine 2-epimerase [Marinomonas sp. MED121]EAQ65694.1 UDP-N-acetylglucosamine 2-epimerase [Marinomonas sp. MED121]